jgi:hypothetical protein
MSLFEAVLTTILAALPSLGGFDIVPHAGFWDWFIGVITGGRGGGRNVAPEIDASSGLAAIALVMSVGLVVYNRFKR